MRPLRLMAPTALAALLAAGLSSPLAAAGTSHAAAAWRVVHSIHGQGGAEFTSVTAIAKGDAWAFSDSVATATAPKVWRLTGTTWSSAPAQSVGADAIVASGATSDSNVWFATAGGRVDHWNGTAWRGSATFSRFISILLVLGPTDVWVFGQAFLPGPNLGAWHYDGKSWRRSGAFQLGGGSALSRSSIWAFAMRSVAHFDGHSWTSTSVAGLLPKDSLLCHSYVGGIYAASSTDVWVTAAGGCQDYRGPFVLLHFDGWTWHRHIAPAFGSAGQMIPDGRGGAWIPVVTGVPGQTAMLHEVAGRLTSVALPFGPDRGEFSGASIGSETSAALAVGSVHSTSFATSSFAGVILQYGP